VVENLDLVVAALAAGAAAGASGTASAAATDAYEGLKGLVRKAVRRGASQTGEPDPPSEEMIDEQLGAPEQHRDDLVAALTAATADRDTELIEAARRVLELTGPTGSRTQKYVLDVHGNQGVQVGDGNNMTLYIK
jgi:hypothetical protein